MLPVLPFILPHIQQQHNGLWIIYHYTSFLFIHLSTVRWIKWFLIFCLNTSIWFILFSQFYCEIFIFFLWFWLSPISISSTNVSTRRFYRFSFSPDDFVDLLVVCDYFVISFHLSRLLCHLLLSFGSPSSCLFPIFVSGRLGGFS